MWSHRALSKCSQSEIQESIAQEMREAVIEAAQPAVPGESVKATLLRAHRNLGSTKFWRVRAAWKGEAGDWSATAVEEFRGKLNALRVERDKRKYAAATVMGQRLRAMRDGLQRTDPEFFGSEIDALSWALRRCRGEDQHES